MSHSADFKPSDHGAKMEIVASAHVVRAGYYIQGHETRTIGELPAAVFYARGPNRATLAEAMADLVALTGRRSD